MMVVSPAGTSFRIDVKGLYSPNYWIIRRRAVESDLYYVLAYVPEPPKQCEFFVLTHAQVVAAQYAEVEEWRIRRPEIDHSYPVQGLKWTAAKAFQNHREVLPN